MSAHHCGIGAGAPGHVKPRHVSLRHIVHLTLKFEFHFTAQGANAHARAGIGDDAQALVTAEVISPMVRVVAIHMYKKIVVVLAR